MVVKDIKEIVKGKATLAYIKAGGFAPLGEMKSTWIFKQLELIAHKYDFKL